ncbi:MAG TPA: MFS transporter [Candidatus Eisenbacteria bacterium]|nr:MFS transporter [Candidatus Eisenbacteria bacterium]
MTSARDIKAPRGQAAPSGRGTYYGWWIVLAAFLNLFFVVGIIFYGFPVFYPYFVESLGFTRAQLTQGFLLGFLFAGLPFGILAGALIDRVGARFVILVGVCLVSAALILMGTMRRFWQFELLCVVEVIGYVFAGPIANQVLVAQWFERRRGKAMGYAYLGLGLGGVVAPMFVNYLARNLGWRHALELIGALILVVLVPTGLWITRSRPADRQIDPESFGELPRLESQVPHPGVNSSQVSQVVRLAPFWLILAGSALAIGAIGAVIQHFILFLKDSGYSATVASRYSSILLISSLGGRVIVGHIADHFRKSRIMAIFYFLIGASVFLLAYPQSTAALSLFALVFGFSMGADYMLIPLVASENFGTAALGKILALIIMGYSIGQWAGPWLVGKLFDMRHSYDVAWKMIAVLAIIGASAIYAIPVFAHPRPTPR